MRNRILGILLVAGLATGQAANAATPLDAGHFTTASAASPVLIAAPHGGFDRFTDSFAREVALMCGASYLLADGFRTTEHPWNVNRPTEGVKLKADDEPLTADARTVFTAYASHVSKLSPRLYVEIHGNSRPESAGWTEVATQGVSEDDARWIKGEFERRVAAMPDDVKRFGIRIEPLDPLHYQASSVKRQGVFRQVPIALHFETPWAMRANDRVRGRYAAVIAGCVDGYWRRVASH